MRLELASVNAEIAALRRELGLPAAGPLPGAAARRPVSMLPRTMTEEQRQVQSALAMSAGATSAAAAVEPYVPPRTIKIKRQVSGIDGMRTMSPQNPLSRPQPEPEVDEEEDEEDDDEEADWAPLTRQVSGVRGMHVL